MPEARHSMLLSDARQTSSLPANAPLPDPILDRAGTRGAAQAPLAGYLGLGSKRLRRLAGRRR
jgi:hypothetical protein